MSVVRLDRLDRPAPAASSPGGPDHPMRRMTKVAAFEPDGWTAERRREVTELFDSLASEWHTRATAERHVPLLDALDRGGSVSGPCLELGSGIGLGTETLARRVDGVIAVDLSGEMLRRAPAGAAPRVLADSSRLPVGDAAVGAVVAVNMFLFPAEVDRVLAPGGTLVWVSSLGDQTPIHLDADEVDRALGGGWDVVASAAGQGTWAVARRHDADRSDPAPRAGRHDRPDGTGGAGASSEPPR